MKQSCQLNEDETGRPEGKEAPKLTMPAAGEYSISLLTGGIDRPYVYGLTDALSSIGVTIDRSTESWLIIRG